MWLPAVAAGENVTGDGAVRIANPELPRGGVQTFHLEELWRLGPVEDEQFFGVISQVLCDDDGRVYLLDGQLEEVQIYDAAGRYLHTLSRSGEGPGEIRRPRDMLFLPDGTLGIVQGFTGRIVKLNLDGTPAGDFVPDHGQSGAGGRSALTAAAYRGGRLVLSGTRTMRQQAQWRRLNFLASFGVDGRESTRYLTKEISRDLRDPRVGEAEEYFPHAGRWTLGPDGRLYVAASRNSYAVNVYDAAGRLEKIITRSYQRWRRDAADKARLEAWAQTRFRHARTTITHEFDEFEPDIAQLRVTDDGHLWVLPSRGLREQPDGVILTYDVFDPKGQFVKQIAFAGPGDGREDGLFFPSEERSILVTGLADARLTARGGQAVDDEDEEMESAPLEVICFRVRPATVTGYDP